MIVFPMSGLSRRFSEQGYKLPKYMLSARGKSLFYHVLNGFRYYFDSVEFLFVVRDVLNTVDFVREQCRNLRILDYRVVVLSEPTQGQAETVLIGLKNSRVDKTTPITIFNIDTIRRNFRFPDDLDSSQTDGYLEVFRGAGSNWSYVRPHPSFAHRVSETAEKVAISDLCCTGLYHFSAAEYYIEAFDAFISDARLCESTKELYVAPLYNLLIAKGRSIEYRVISADEVEFCGTPSEYQSFLLNACKRFGNTP